jgi:DNA ligase-1
MPYGWGRLFSLALKTRIGTASFMFAVSRGQRTTTGCQQAGQRCFLLFPYRTRPLCPSEQRFLQHVALLPVPCPLSVSLLKQLSARWSQKRQNLWAQPGNGALRSLGSPTFQTTAWTGRVGGNLVVRHCSERYQRFVKLSPLGRNFGRSLGVRRALVHSWKKDLLAGALMQRLRRHRIVCSAETSDAGNSSSSGSERAVHQETENITSSSRLVEPREESVAVSADEKRCDNSSLTDSDCFPRADGEASTSAARAAEKRHKTSSPSPSQPIGGLAAVEDADPNHTPSSNEDDMHASEVIRGSASQREATEASPAKKRSRKVATKKRSLSTKSNAESDDEDKKAGLYGALASTDYVTLLAPSWEPGHAVPYSFLADAFERMSATTGRIDLSRQLACVFYHILERTPADLLPAIYLVINRLAPAHEGLEIGVGDALLLQALADATGRSLSKLKEDYHQTGDLGDVAVHSRTTQRTMFTVPRLSVRTVYSEFLAIARASGKAMQEEKRRRIQKLLVAAKENEAKFIARALQGRLRIRLAEKTVILALAAAVVLVAERSRGGQTTSARIEQAAHLLRSVCNECPSWNLITEALLDIGDIDEQLYKRCHLTPGLPVMPMLAKPSRSVAEILTRFEGTQFTCEYKYDGERAQIHGLADGTIRIYSRNAEDHTRKYPDVMEQICSALISPQPHPTFILDTEVVAYDRDTRQILPFQHIQQRARKHVSTTDLKTHVIIVAFDILFWRDESLTRKTLAERRSILHEAFRAVTDGFRFAITRDVMDPDGIRQFMDEAVRESCEGLMVKALRGPLSTYEPANRTQNWLKLKKDYLQGIGDTLDLVPIGAYYGRGKRTGWFGSFLLACYNPDTEQFEAVTRVGTGFSEEQMAQLHTEHAQYVLDGQRPYVACSESVKPDVWLDPRQVWEVQCADLSLSPAYVAALGYIVADKGISVRFPRLVRIRTDKKPEEATTSTQLADMYRNQFRSMENSSSESSGTDSDPEKQRDHTE